MSYNVFAAQSFHRNAGAQPPGGIGTAQWEPEKNSKTDDDGQMPRPPSIPHCGSSDISDCDDADEQASAASTITMNNPRAKAHKFLP
jgi:hypothetical protein